MPLRNRLEEVISRYEKASTLVKNYKEGAISEDDLGKGFKRLRKERKAVDEHNRSYIREQRRLHLGDELARKAEEEEDSVEAAETLGSDEVDDDDESYEDEDYDEDEDGDYDEHGEIDAAPSAQDSSAQGEDTAATAKPTRSIKEKKLWRQYGSFWDSV